MVTKLTRTKPSIHTVRIGQPGRPGFHKKAIRWEVCDSSYCESRQWICEPDDPLSDCTQSPSLDG